MKKIASVLILIVVFLSSNSFAQNNTTFPFESIEPTNEKFEDLKFLEKVIGDKSIVMIGEQDHFAGASIDAKARICNYLIKEMGFEVILFEAGFYDVNRAIIYDKENKTNNFRRSLYFLWALNEHITPFLNKLSNEAIQDKIYLEGFDPKFTSPFSSKFYINDLEKVLSKINFVYSDQTEWNTFKQIIQKGADKYDKKIIKLDDKQRKLLYKVSTTLSNFLEKANEKYWANVVKNNTTILVEYSKVSMKDIVSNNEKADYLDNVRDSLMAENAKFIIEKYKGKKIIIWAASYHIAKSPDIISRENKGYNFKGKRVMGDIVAQYYPNQTFNIGFISYKGKWGVGFGSPNKGTKLVSHNENSMEHYIHLLNAPFCFINMNDSQDIKSKSAMINGFETIYKSQDWSKNFDALIYIENMYPNVLKQTK